MSRKDLVEIAKVAEQAERYDDMAKVCCLMHVKGYYSKARKKKKMHVSLSPIHTWDGIVSSYAYRT